MTTACLLTSPKSPLSTANSSSMRSSPLLQAWLTMTSILSTLKAEHSGMDSDMYVHSAPLLFTVVEVLPVFHFQHAFHDLVTLRFPGSHLGLGSLQTWVTVITQPTAVPPAASIQRSNTCLIRSHNYRPARSTIMPTAQTSKVPRPISKTPFTIYPTMACAAAVSSSTTTPMLRKTT